MSKGAVNKRLLPPRNSRVFATLLKRYKKMISSSAAVEGGAHWVKTLTKSLNIPLKRSALTPIYFGTVMLLKGSSYMFQLGTQKEGLLSRRNQVKRAKRSS